MSVVKVAACHYVVAAVGEVKRAYGHGAVYILYLFAVGGVERVTETSPIYPDSDMCNPRTEVLSTRIAAAYLLAIKRYK